jgi:SAM-dependent methyltransferase
MGRQWRLLAPPLRPCADDVRVVEETTAAWVHAHPGGRLRALVLGVTPELAALRWPAGTSLVALDKSQGMIDAVWPRERVPPGATARCADWLASPLDDASVDVVAGDGVLNVIPSLADAGRLCGEVGRMLAPGGRFVVRVFVAPDPQEPLAAIERDLWARRIGSFHVLKWRLLMAVQDPVSHSVCLGDAWTAWRGFCPDPRALTEKLGWAPEVVATIDAYRGAPTRFTFPTRLEAKAILAEAFEEIACHEHAYELGERCPTWVLAPRTARGVT